MVFLTAPLGIIGVASFLLLFGQPFGFVAMLGTIALLGMIMRNSVILIDQIRQDLESGHSPFDAVVEATVRRLRPIALTALAAVLAMIPLSRSVFWGPMAVAIMGGLIVATIAGIIATAIQIAYLLVRGKKVDGALWVSMVVFLFFGGLTFVGAHLRQAYGLSLGAIGLLLGSLSLGLVGLTALAVLLVLAATP